jgi:hypothetical protein
LAPAGISKWLHPITIDRMGYSDHRLSFTHSFFRSTHEKNTLTHTTIYLH